MLCGCTSEEDEASMPSSGEQSQEVSRVWKPSSAVSSSISEFFFSPGLEEPGLIKCTY